MKNFKKNIVGFILISISVGSFAQSNEISFYQLGDYVQQTANVSPANIPKNSFSFNVIGVTLGISNGFKASDLLTTVPGSETVDPFTGKATKSLHYDFKNVYNSLESDYNTLNNQIALNILNLTFKRKHGSLSFFINAKEEINWQMSKNGLINLLANGITEEVLINDRVNSTSYTEAGIGLTQQFLKDKLTVGVRVKYLSGITNASTQEDGYAKITVNNDLTWTINTQDAVTKVAGVTDNKNSISLNGNNGIGFDFGTSYKITPRWKVDLSLNDIGSIKWTQNVKEYYIEDTTDLIVEGSNLNESDPVKALIDKLKEDVTTGERVGNSFTTQLNTKAYMSTSYKLGNVHLFRATAFKNIGLNDNNNPTYALGYNLALKKTTVGLVGIQNNLGNTNLGLNFAAKLAFLQMYFATDNIDEILGKPEDIKNINLKLGLNFVFGYKKWQK